MRRPKVLRGKSYYDRNPPEELNITLDELKSVEDRLNTQLEKKPFRLERIFLTARSQGSKPTLSIRMKGKWL